MAVIFHQNMLNFGGAAPARNVAYLGSFAALSAQLAAMAAPQQIYVAGFTEILNDIATVPTLGALCGAGGLGMAFQGNFACGRTALAAGGPEYIGIGVRGAPGVVIHGIGRIFFGVEKGMLVLLNDSSALPYAAGWNRTLPDNASLDYRGVIYVVLTLPGIGTVSVGFIHNLYTFEAQRSLVRNSLPRAVDIMMTPIAGSPAIAGVYLGGDFNLPPGNVGTVRTGQCLPHFIGMAARPATYPLPLPFAIGGTTAAASEYDYWYSANGFAAPAGVQTWGDSLGYGPGGGHMSDHCGIVALM